MFKNMSTKAVAFAGSENNAVFYSRFKDFYFHAMEDRNGQKVGSYNAALSLAEKEARVNDEFLAEVYRVAGYDNAALSVKPEVMASNPQFQWAFFAVVNMLIGEVLPDTVVKSIGLWTDTRFVDFGDSPLFEVPSRALFTVSRSANAQRTALIQRQYRGNVEVTLHNHKITTSVDMYSVLSGRMNLADMAQRAVLSIETQITRDAYVAVVDGLTAVGVPAALKYEGAFDMTTLIKQCQVVGAYNFGRKPVIAGTVVGLMNVVPDSAAGYRLNASADAPKIGLIRTVYEYDFFVLPQVATGNYTDYGVVLDDDLLMVMSPASDKLVQGVIEGSTLTNGNNYYDNADLTGNFSIEQRWGFSFVSGSVGASYRITA